MMKRYFQLTITAVTLAVALTMSGQGKPKPSTQQQTFKAPDTLDFRSANIMSEGVRLHAERFSLKTLAGKQLPTIIMAHGWGGVTFLQARRRPRDSPVWHSFRHRSSRLPQD